MVRCIQIKESGTKCRRKGLFSLTFFRRNVYFYFRFVRSDGCCFNAQIGVVFDMPSPNRGLYLRTFHFITWYHRVYVVREGG